MIRHFFIMSFNNMFYMYIRHEATLKIKINNSESSLHVLSNRFEKCSIL